MFDITLITPWAWILLGVGCMAMLIFLTLGPLRYRRLIRVVNAQNANDNRALPLDADGMPLRVSVIAVTKGDRQEVHTFLESMAAQDYPDLEVIMVVDGAARDASNLAETFSETYPNTSFTFVPPEALNLSRRKLGNTIGIKKATGQIILTTLTNIQIPSAQWISLMADPFANPDVEIVLGAAFMDFAPMTGLKRWYRRFDSLLRSEEWMVAAIDGTPYRGDGTNLAFRRELFFRNSGYGNNYYLHAGDDDIFVSQVATAANTRFMFASDATVRVQWGNATNRIWKNHKVRYAFAEQYLNHPPRLRRAMQNLCCWISTLALVAAAVISLPANLIAPGLALLLLLSTCEVEIRDYRSLAATFHSPRLWWSLPIFYLIRPIADLLFGLKHRRHRAANFTWRR